MKFPTAEVNKRMEKFKDCCALCERCFHEKNKFKRHMISLMSSLSCPVCSWLLFLEEMVLVRLKRVTPGILLHVLTMLTKVMCTLQVTFSMKVGHTEIKDDSKYLFSIKGGRLEGCQEGRYESYNQCD